MTVSVSLPADVLARYERFSLYNSPYVAHDRGCAIDLYPGPETAVALSPVSGTILDTMKVNAPPKPYAPPHDHLILVDCGDRIARVLHVDPVVETGDRIAVGDSLGTLVRAGFFAPWVDNHVHLGFRAPDANPYRAAGSLPIVPAVRPLALDWDGTGTVVDTGETYAILDAPTHPSPGAFAGIAGSVVPGASGATEATEAIDTSRVVLDGGLPHYDGGGALPAGRARSSDSGTWPATNDPNVSRSSPSNPPGPTDGRIDFLGTEIGVVEDRTIVWHPVSVSANDRPITGLSLFCGQDPGFGAKLVCPETGFEPGERVTVSIRSAD